MKRSIDRRLGLAALIGFILGMVWLIAVRFIVYQSNNVHFHANFALYINGERDPFDNFTFYEEVQSCGADEQDNPKNRVHMHDHVNHVVHVHDHAVTWGQFFANLGYTLGDTLIRTDHGTYQNGTDGNELTFILNGQEVSEVANEPIKSEDVLLINYGKETIDVLSQRYDTVTKDAATYNKRNDPSSCTGTKQASFSERLKRSVLY